MMKIILRLVIMVVLTLFACCNANAADTESRVVIGFNNVFESFTTNNLPLFLSVESTNIINLSSVQVLNSALAQIAADIPHKLESNYSNLQIVIESSTPQDVYDNDDESSLVVESSIESDFSPDYYLSAQVVAFNMLEERTAIPNSTTISTVTSFDIAVNYKLIRSSDEHLMKQFTILGQSGSARLLDDSAPNGYALNQLITDASSDFIASLNEQCAALNGEGYLLPKVKNE